MWEEGEEEEWDEEEAEDGYVSSLALALWTQVR